MKVLVLPGSHSAPAARFRLWQFVMPLRELGHRVEVRVISPERYWVAPDGHPIKRRVLQVTASLVRFASACWCLRGAASFDAVIMNRDLVPETRIRFLEIWLTRRNPNVIFDFDDAIFLGNRAAKMAHILPHFRLVAAGNEHLAQYARQYAREVAVWPTVVDTERWIPRAGREPGPVRLGWSGSRSTMTHCLLLESAMTELAKTTAFEFIVVSDEAPTFQWPGVRVRYLRWSAETEVQSLHLMDIGLMPLKDEPFERGKCGAKAITYMAVGIPAVVSPVGINVNLVTPGVSGFHCTTSEEWVAALCELIQDADIRQRMGEAGRQAVIDRYSVRSVLPRLDAAIRHTAARAPVAPAHTL
jgi:glycosyltransferase involved in cell wall biosynthesis